MLSIEQERGLIGLSDLRSFIMIYNTFNMAYRQIFTMQTLLSGKLNKVLSSRSNDLFTFRLSSVIIM